MAKVKRSLQEKEPQDVELAMKKFSIGVSFVAVFLMLGGLVLTSAVTGFPRWPGGTVIPIPAFLHPSRVDPGLLAVSAGVVLLGLLPALRVVLALGIYISRRQVGSIIISLIVIFELLVSLTGLGG